MKGLRGFLGLTGYYRRFVKGYGIISRPLTNLLKKDGFRWDAATEEAFCKLKQAMSEVPTLRLPDFNKQFILEIDASNNGIGAVLVQEGKPIAFLSQALAPRYLRLSIYEKELLAVLMAVERCRHYLEGGSFVIKTNHESLKFLLQQKLQTQLQRKGMTKLMGLNYVIQYRKGKKNLAANALSRCLEEGSAVAISTIVPDWCQEIAASYLSSDKTRELLQQLAVNPSSKPGYTLSNGMIRLRGKLVIGEEEALKRRIIEALHASPIGGHSVL